MTDFIVQVLQLMFGQLIAVFGIFFIFVLILSELQEMTLRNYNASVGWRGILWTAWLGTPLHEFGHILFAILFRHHITGVTLYRPDPASGELGSVSYSFNPKSWYQKIGNFFIGLGPLLFGVSLLALLAYWVLPDTAAVTASQTLSTMSIFSVFQIIFSTVPRLFVWSNISQPQFWLFLYVAFCIASHLAPSRQDRRGMWRGFLTIIGTLFVIDVLALLLGVDIGWYVVSFAQLLQRLMWVFIFTTAVSIVHVLVSAAVRLFFSSMRQ